VNDAVIDAEDYWTEFWEDYNFLDLMQALQSSAKHLEWMEGLQNDIFASFLPADDADRFHPEWALPCFARYCSLSAYFVTI
jgi:hypothetical protein